MKFLKRTVALAFAALWLPVSMHCSLETIPGFNVIDWCCDTAPQPAKDDCAQDGCAEIEAGLYRVEDNPALTPNPATNLATTPPGEALQTPKPAQTIDLSPDRSPPELAQIWQFSLRAALPPRAPSFVS